MERSTKLIVGILAAGAVGMLIAPEKGKKFYASVKDSIQDLGEKLTDVIEDGQKYINTAKKTVISEAVGLKDDIQDDVMERVGSTKQALTDLGKQLVKNMLTRTLTKVGTNYLKQILK
jgi:gas vesicle protein